MHPGLAHNICRLGLAAVYMAAAICCAQEGEVATFGTTVVIPGGLTGRIYNLPVDTQSVPNFSKLESAGTIYAKALYVPVREFREGFPGITDRIEWFGIDFTGRTYIANPGKYRFQLCSDDGSKLYFDGKVVVDNSFHHPFTCEEGTVKLSGGIHNIRVSYFQGHGAELGLTLAVMKPDEKRFRVFNTDEFAPPSNPADWKFGAPETLNTPVPDSKRIQPAEAVEPKDPVVSISVSVLSPNGPLRDLKLSDFIVRDQNEVQEITGFTYGTQPLDAVLLFDGSPRVAPFINRLKTGASSALSALGANDHVGVVVFGEKQMLTLGLAANRDILLSAIRKVDGSQGEKDLNGAVALTAQYLLENRRPDSKAAIVIVTDNRGSLGITNRVTRDMLWRANVTLSALIVPSEEPPGQADVRQFIDVTGGDIFSADETSVPFAEVLRGLRERYSITYRAPAAKPRSIRTLSIELTAAAKQRVGPMQIRARGAYVVEEPTPTP